MVDTSHRGAAGPDAAAPPASDLSRRGRTRERLLDAALEVFAEHGVHVATVEQVTERAGFTRGAFYSNFTSKEELFFALMEREDAVRARTLAQGLEQSRPRIGAALERGDAAALGEAILDLFVGPRDDRTWCLVQAEFTMLAMRDRSVATRLLDHQRRFFASLHPLLEGAIEQAGRAFVLDTGATLRLLAAVYEDALRASILAGQDVQDVDRVRTELARTVLVLTRPATPASRVPSAPSGPVPGCGNLGVSIETREGHMRAVVGDRLHVHSRAVGGTQQFAEVIEVQGADGAPPYRVRYADGHEAIVFPGPDATIEHHEATSSS